MQKNNIYLEHHAEYPWQFVDKDRTCHLMLRCFDKVDKIEVLYGDPFCFWPGAEKKPVLERMKVQLSWQANGIVCYTAAVPMNTRKLRYHFEITSLEGTIFLLTEQGLIRPVEEEQIRPFFVPYVFETEKYLAPQWAEKISWYQIFPERFHDEKGNQGGEKFLPGRENFFGGTLEGIREKIPYIKSLGIQGVYINPIFSSISNHRYDIADYTKLDVRLGQEKDLKELVNALHQSEIRIMLDGVYNHCGWDNSYWQNIRSHGKRSKYYNWFIIYDEQAVLHEPLSAFTDERMRTDPPYECFAFAANMPKWNTSNPEVMDFLISQAEAWTINYHIDAWRLDVPDEINREFLYQFRNRMKKIKPDLLIIGEIWNDGKAWMEKFLFDATMDYPLYFIVRDFALEHKDSLETFCQRIERYLFSLPEPTRGNQWGFCSNHDIPRALFLASGDYSAMKKAYFLTALFGGSISIYYGDEIGMTGGADPDNRRAMIWNERNWDNAMREYIKELLLFQKQYCQGSALRCLNIKSPEVAEVILEKNGETIKVCITSKNKGYSIPQNQNDELIFGIAEKGLKEWNVSNGFAAWKIE